MGCCGLLIRCGSRLTRTSDAFTGVGGFGSTGEPFVDGGLFPSLIASHDHVGWRERPVLLDGGE